MAVEQGYLKQLTVDFFLSNLFKIYNPQNCSFTDVYAFLRKYNKGETSFPGIGLKRAPLLGISLKQIKLDGSDLRRANLRGSNLNNSSLVQVNLALANLSKAVLTNSNLTRSLLNYANLQEAHLDGVNFDSAKLHYEDLRRAYLLRASFSGADLRGAQLDSNYGYEVFYNERTIFPEGFDPIAAGWTRRQKLEASKG